MFLVQNTHYIHLFCQQIIEQMLIVDRDDCVNPSATFCCITGLDIVHRAAPQLDGLRCGRLGASSSSTIKVSKTALIEKA